MSMDRTSLRYSLGIGPDEVCPDGHPHPGTFVPDGWQIYDQGHWRVAAERRNRHPQRLDPVDEVGLMVGLSIESEGAGKYCADLMSLSGAHGLSADHLSGEQLAAWLQEHAR